MDFVHVREIKFVQRWFWNSLDDGEGANESWVELRRMSLLFDFKAEIFHIQVNQVADLILWFLTVMSIGLDGLPCFHGDVAVLC